jgi:hypothetical protein
LQTLGQVGGLVFGDDDGGEGGHDYFKKTMFS